MAQEMEEDAKEPERFRQAGRVERVYLFWKEICDMKKYCFISIVLTVVLILNIIQLVVPPEFIQTGTIRVLEAVWKNCTSPPRNETDCPICPMEHNTNDTAN